jgi:hypothetical protein
MKMMTPWWRRASAWALAIALSLPGAGCRAGADGTADNEAQQLTPGGARTVPPWEERHFDPATLRVGDRFHDLVVVDREVRRVFEDSVWAGHYRFAGEITVRGTFERHFDWPEPAALCFWITEPDQVQRIPDFAPDTWTAPDARTWFCFSNPALAEELLGPGDAPREATIVVDDYLSVREFSDVFDTARLVRVTAR